MSCLMCFVKGSPVLVFLRDSDWPFRWQLVYFGIAHSRFLTYRRTQSAVFIVCNNVLESWLRAEGGLKKSGDTCTLE